MSYEPTPGSIPDRVLAYLGTQPPGTELMSSRLAECVGIDPGGLSATLESAVQAGRLFKRQKDRQYPRSPMFWSLTDHAAAGPAFVSRALDVRKTPPPSFPQAITQQLSRQAHKAQANGHDPETHALRAAVPEPTAKSIAALGDAQRADDRRPPQGEPPRAEVIAPYCAPPVATSATPDASNRQRIPPGLQHVLKAEAATPDATDRGPGPFRCALWSTGELVIQRGTAEWVLGGAETRQLVRYLDSVLLERAEADEQPA